MRWKIFQWMKFLFRHSSNSRKLSRQKFHNELACVFTAHYASKNADWNQQQLTDGGILVNWNSENHPYCFLSNQKKVQIPAFLHVIRQRNVSCPHLRERHKGIIGRGHDLRLTIRRPRVQVSLWPLVGFVHGRSEFKSSATLASGICSFPLALVL